MRQFLTMTVLLLGLSACTSIERHPTSLYRLQSTEAEAFRSTDDFYQARAQKNWTEAMSQLGLQTEDGTLTEDAFYKVRSRVMLQRLESQLEYELEKRQYYNYRPYFKSDNDRIRFLKLPSREAREQYAQELGLVQNQNELDPVTLSIVEKGDVTKGMSRKAVEQSWGEPDLREYAGRDFYGNERWHYRKLVSTSDGYRHERRIIYFEGGRVVGWETQ